MLTLIVARDSGASTADADHCKEAEFIVSRNVHFERNIDSFEIKTHVWVESWDSAILFARNFELKQNILRLT